jgi:LDH2 family malate/lactate/ureidoglycolate dehydrogenase
MRYPIHLVRTVIFDALLKLGHSHEDATIITNVLLYAELRANNQGVIKLVAGALNPHQEAQDVSIEFSTPISARIHGHNKIGMVVVHNAVEIAITKAKVTGMAIVGCSGYASATGALGYWAREITNCGFIGIIMSQCPEMVAPHGSCEAIFGTNPIAIGVPTLPRAQIVDMATSAIAYYGIKLAEQLGEPIPNDVAFDARGYPTTNPTEALQGAIRVFDRSYKGSHLALMVELLAGAFTGAAMENKTLANNWGSLVIAIDPNVMGNREQFLANAQIMCDRVKNARKLAVNSDATLYLPGERGDDLERENLEMGTVDINEALFFKLEALC